MSAMGTSEMVAALTPNGSFLGSRRSAYAVLLPGSAYFVEKLLGQKQYAHESVLV